MSGLLSRLRTPELRVERGLCLRSVFRDNDFTIYLTSNKTMPDFRGRLDALEDAILDSETRIVVGGDFNARALEGGIPHPDSRRKRILEMVASTGLVASPSRSIPTFRHPSCEGSIPDVTFASGLLVSLVNGWRVLEDFSVSDHQYITFEVVDINSWSQRSFGAGNIAKVNTGGLSKLVEQVGPHWKVILGVVALLGTG